MNMEDHNKATLHRFGHFIASQLTKSHRAPSKNALSNMSAVVCGSNYEGIAFGGRPL